VLDQLQTRGRAIAQPSQRTLAGVYRPLAQILAFELEEIEGIQDCFGVDPLAMAEAIKHGHAALIADHYLSVDQAGRDLERVQRLEHGWVSVGPVVAIASE
jgi:hypothetical protein